MQRSTPSCRRDISTATHRRRQSVLQLPAGPAFRVEKEIKNVVVALARACHYWDGHLTGAEQSLAGEGVREAATPAEAAERPSEYDAAVAELENGLREVGLPTSPRRYVGWVGVETAGEEVAVWLLRAVLVERVLARREGKVLYFPVAQPRVQTKRPVAGGRSGEPWNSGRRARRVARPGDRGPCQINFASRVHRGNDRELGLRGPGFVQACEWRLPTTVPSTSEFGWREHWPMRWSPGGRSSRPRRPSAL